MLYRIILTINIMSFVNANSLSQSFTGQFVGISNGDSVLLDLSKANINSFTGKLKDSKQTYQITAVQKGNTIKGKAKETYLGITFDFKAVAKTQDQLQCILSMTLFGNTQADSFLLQRKNTKPEIAKRKTTDKPAVKTTNNTIATALKGKVRDAKLVGSWCSQSVYNSGYGNDQFSGAVREGMTFTSDGKLVDAGSTVVMGGSNNNGTYGGSSEGKNANDDTVFWYTANQQLYVVGLENGSVQTVHVGRYYIEGNKLLLTGVDGKKKLLYKSN